MHKIILILVLGIAIFPLSLQATENYQIVMTDSGSGNWGAIRYQPDNGRAWYVKAGEFIEILEQQIPGESRYKVMMSRTDKGWGAVRLDVLSGDTWFLKNRQWIKVKEEPTP